MARALQRWKRVSLFDNPAGWVVAGHPLVGPLTLASSAGTTTEYSNGFTFDNDDITAGVEADIGSAAFGDFALQRTNLLRFYHDAENKLVAIRGPSSSARWWFPFLARPASQVGTSWNHPRPPQGAVVLHSANGTDWESLWSSEQAGTNDELFISNLVVGEDEILITTPIDIARIPIGNELTPGRRPFLR